MYLIIKPNDLVEYITSMVNEICDVISNASKYIFKIDEEFDRELKFGLYSLISTGIFYHLTIEKFDLMKAIIILNMIKTKELVYKPRILLISNEIKISYSFKNEFMIDPSIINLAIKISNINPLDLAVDDIPNLFRILDLYARFMGVQGTSTKNRIEKLASQIFKKESTRLTIKDFLKLSLTITKTFLSSESITGLSIPLNRYLKSVETNKLKQFRSYKSLKTREDTESFIWSLSSRKYPKGVI